MMSNNGGLVQRRKQQPAASSSEYLDDDNPNTSNERLDNRRYSAEVIADDNDKGNKLNKLTLLDEVFLLGLKDAQVRLRLFDFCQVYFAFRAIFHFGMIIFHTYDYYILQFLIFF